MSTLRRCAALLAALALSLLLLTGPAAAERGKDRARGKPAKAPASQPLVIAHRGASGYRPEHTLAAYVLGARMGADYVEPDLVATRDGVLVARHENEIKETTDVASRPEFADRRRKKIIDGVELDGWFTEDFTLAELKTLRVKERIPALRPRNTIYDGRYEVPTLQEVIDLTRRLSKELGREIGIYPETKHPTYFRTIGLPLEEPLVATLKRNGLHHKRAKVFVQSFEVSNLKALDRRVDAPLVQLLGSAKSSPADVVAAGGKTTYGEMATRSGLRGVAAYADGVGPSKDYIVPRTPQGGSAAPTGFVADAHAAGLLVHPYTFRNENAFLPLELRFGTDPAQYGNAFAEYGQFLGLGIDGLFSDNPDTAAEAVGAR